MGKARGRVRNKAKTVVIAEPVGMDLDPILLPGPGEGKNRPKIKPAVREYIYARDKYRCTYCGSNEDLTIDHVIPLSKGGRNHKTNMTTACKPCNAAKADEVIK